MEGHIIKLEYIMGRWLPGETPNDHAKYVLRLIIEKLVKDPAFSDLTETAIRDVLITMLKDWNYYHLKRG